jgi:type III secretion protein C
MNNTPKNCHWKNIARITLNFLILMATMNHSALFAAEIRWKMVPYSHYAQQEKLSALLADFFSGQGVGLVCSKNLKATISGNFNAKDPRKFFEDLTHVYNLAWYYDGAAVYIYPAHEMTSKILNLGYINMKVLKESLDVLGIVDKRFGLNMVEEDRIVFVSGPPRYVDLVAELAEKLDEKAMSGRGREDIINVFPLKHAWADDKTLSFHDKELVIPGVATLLRNVITGQTSPGQVAGWRKREIIKENVGKLKGKGLSRYNIDSKQKENSARDNGQPSKQQHNINLADDRSNTTYATEPPEYTDTDEGVIEADPRQNAVLVRDREEKMPYYEKIIALLDVPVGLVEIRATIIDVDRNNMQNLGVQWQFKSKSADDQSITKGGLNTNEAYSEGDDLHLNMPIGSGFNIATIIGDSRNFFLSQVNALQEKGHANILSRPSVLTMNNVEAQLEHSKTFYVRVEGTEEVDLFDVTAGVTLRVTPHIIEENETRRIKLAIQIKDGSFPDMDEEVVDNIPIVQNSIINTQAVVGEKESLLIGGYLRDEKTTTNRQIPCLGDIPLVGWLFKSKSNNDKKSERLFMITPTIVPYGSSNTPDDIPKGVLLDRKESDKPKTP